MASTQTPPLSDRVRRLKESLLAVSPRLSTERLRLLAESYRETDGEPPVARRAAAFRNVLKGMTIFIDENPIVGTLTCYRGGTQPYPEAACGWMRREVEESFETSMGKGDLTAQDKELLLEAVAYWQNRCSLGRTQAVWSASHPEGLKRSDHVIKAMTFADSIGHPNEASRVCLDYGKVLNKGLNGVIREAERAAAALPAGALESCRRRDFLNGVIIACEGLIAFARRYARLAEAMAATEPAGPRQDELLRIAHACERVPAEPARDFYEALQSFWFVHLGSLIECCSTGHSPGRFSQYMFPFYERSMRADQMGPEEAIELLELLFIKFTEVNLHLPRREFETFMSNLFQNISLGGMNADGSDATNELDILLLETQRRVRVIQPTLSILYHKRISRDLLLKAGELVKTGIGMPAFFNADIITERLLEHGGSLEDARDHCILGCAEGAFSHRLGTTTGGQINMPKLLELALYDGRDPRTGLQVGPHTGEAHAFGTFAALCTAVRLQLEHCLKLYSEFEYTGLAMTAEHLPAPFCSALIDDCISRGLPMNAGGSRYAMNGGGPVGMIDLADSLVAICRVVYEDKALTMGQLLEALDSDFAGREDLRALLLRAPKYGNDVEQVDTLAREWYSIFYEEHQKYVDHLGRRLKPFALSTSIHFPFGAAVGALPSGRRAAVPLADGSVSASPGMDTNGPTALARSAARAIDTVKYACSLLNMKFHPSSLKDRDGLQKLVDLVRTYMDLGGYHIQFNVVSGETLRHAQAHPEEHRDLIVRVAGFSAFFIHLDPVVQGEIIKRTELNL